MVIKLEHGAELSSGLLKYCALGHTLRVSDLEDLRWGPRAGVFESLLVM